MRFLPAFLLSALVVADSAFGQIADVGGKGARGIPRLFENYDLRVSEPPGAAAKEPIRAAYRVKQVSPVRRAALQSMSAGMAAARMALAARVPTLQVEMNLAGGVPEVVGVSGGEEFLSAPSSAAARESVARDFFGREATVYGLAVEEVDALVKIADYANPAGNMAWVEFRQEVLGIPVFQGELRCAFTFEGALARTTGNLVPGLDPTALSAEPKLNPAEAAAKAAATINVFVDRASMRVRSTEENGRRSILAGGPFERDTRAELVWFPVEPGVAVLAWSVTLSRPLASYWVLVDAADGTLLWRKNVTQAQTQSVTYSVYLSDSPAPLSPTNAAPGSGIQGTGVARSQVTLVADDTNASPLGWITDGGNSTLGNNVTAGLDIAGPGGVDANVSGSGPRVFNFAYNPPPGASGGTGSSDLTDAEYRKGSVTNLFFWTNRYHDRLWELGFNESARNFQTSNFGRSGTGDDAISAEVQDSSGANNATFTTFPDGSPGIMQLFVFTAPSPRRDSALDADIFLHELTHGTSSRLHGNASGLLTQHASGMSEGWSDFYARCLLATASEDVNATYALAPYSTLNYTTSRGTVGTDNYYYGIRRFPYAVKSNVGVNGKPHNPLTLADIDATKINLSDGAFAPSPAIAGSVASEVHNVGEVWCMMLLEVRARLIQRLGFSLGNERALQIVTDAMKLDPISPSIIQGRDSILAAAFAGPGGAPDAMDAFRAFAARGAGTGATATNPPAGTIIVSESFTTGVFAGPVTSSDGPGNQNGMPEPGETIAISLTLTNPGPTTVSPMKVTIGGSAFAFSLAAGASQPVTIFYQIPGGTSCGATVTVPISILAGSDNSTLNYSFRVGTLITSPVLQNFDGVTAPALPAGWTTTAAAAPGGIAGTPWITTSNGRVDGPNSAFSPDLAGNNNGGGEASLVSPPIPIPAGGVNIAFRHRWSFEAAGGNAWDGGVLEIAIPGVAGGAFRDILTAGGSFIQGGYTAALASSMPTNPIGGRQAFTGTSDVITTVVALPAAANGQSVQLRWRIGFDESTGGTGWNVDTVSFGSFACAPGTDTDGDSLPDAYELANGLNPADPADAALDADGDGVSNLDEFRAGTNPRSSTSVLRASVARAANHTQVSFPSVFGRTYGVEYKDDLDDFGWTALRTNLAGNGETLSINDNATPSSAGRRFYRVIVTGQ